MKRQLLICVIALCLAPAAFAKPVPSASPTLAVDCGDSCVAGTFMTATGSGYNPRITYFGCIEGANYSNCFGLTNGVSNSGDIVSLVRMASTQVPGIYTWSIRHFKGNGAVLDASTTFTLIAPV